MHRCGCGMSIGFFEVYCDNCKENLTLRDKVIEGIRIDKIFGSQSHGLQKCEQTHNQDNQQKDEATHSCSHNTRGTQNE